MGTATKSSGSQTPPRIPITRKLAVTKTSAWNPAKKSPVTQRVRKSRAREMGFDSIMSIEPLAISSGTTLAVEMSARIAASHVSQMLIPRFWKISL